jgi:cell wall-associated NlpC family hydrolase
MKAHLCALFIGLCLPAPGQQPKSSGAKSQAGNLKSARTKAPTQRSASESNPPPSASGKGAYGKPAVIEVKDLKDIASLPVDRQKLISAALAVAQESPWLPYKFGGSSPTDGGFDCSGAMFFVLSRIGIDPPRTSANQYLWLKKADRLHEVSPDVRELTHPLLKHLQPGDLLFWGPRRSPNDDHAPNITHVALFLGQESRDGRAVMINATDGRSYRGTRANGYGVYDFRLPKDGTRTVFMGYGTPPGIAVWGGP